MLLGPANDSGRRDRPIRTGRRDKPIIQLPSVALRVAIMVGIAVVLFTIILFRLWFLQILSGQQFVVQANDNRLRSVKLVAPRGAIVDRHGQVIVENRPGLAVGFRLMDVPDGQLDREVTDLAKVLKMRPGKIRTEIMDHLRPSWPSGEGAWPLTWENVVAGKGSSLDLVVVKEDISERDRSYILEHIQSFPGVETPSNYLRAYPHGFLAAHLLGNIGEISKEQLKERRFKGYAQGDLVGQGGLEWSYDRWLRGRDGVAKVEVDALGRPKQHDPVPGGRLPEPGDTLVTTIDNNVQAKAEEALRYAIDLAHTSGSYKANGAAALVLDVKTGEVIAMASFPTFDPNVWVGGISTKDFKKLSDPQANRPLLNRAIQEQKAVASTFKVVDAIAGLEEGVIAPSTTFFCPGSFKVPISSDDTVWNCWALDGHGTLDLVQAITQSCDVYFYNVGYLFYQRKGTELEDWAVRLGMGKPTGIDIPGEVAGRVPTPAWRRSYFESEVDKLWTPGNSVNLAIGQGDLEATPLQLAVTYAAIANGGSIVQPHIGKKIVDAQGKMVRDLPAAEPRQVDISQSTLDVVRRGLYEAANSVTGTSSAVFAGYPVEVAGKTGTAEVFGAGDYAWYASYAPANDPKYAVVVMVEQGGHGGTVAAPATRLIYDALFKIQSEKVTGAVRSD
ncbi:MAG: penicillin-binding protein 2 [Actinobacteria bacterium]|nr:penicillin-binding protein 2 [Actinomycetota bacterium]